LDLAPVAICAGAMGRLQPRGTDHVQARLAAGATERAAQNLAINRDNALNLRAKARHDR